MPGQSALLYDKINLARGASSIEPNQKSSVLFGIIITVKLQTVTHIG